MNGSAEKPPLLVGIAAARANLVPGLVIQAVMLAVVLAYFWSDRTHAWLDALAAWKARWGYLFSFALAAVAGAVLPEALTVVVFQRGALRRGNIEDFAFAVPFWGLMGVCVDLFYRSQAHWFGTVPTIAVLAKKVAVDQFLYNPLWAAPVTVWAYEWKRAGYAVRENFLTLAFYERKVLPTLIATWGVWIPMVAIIYALPSLLQISLFGLALSFWVLLVSYIASKRGIVPSRPTD